VNPAKGSVAVAGKAVGVSAVFSASGPPPNPSKFTVTFTESGLPNGTYWSVTLNGTKDSSTTATITFQEVNGTYSYTMPAPSGYTVNPSTGLVTVSGKAVGVSVTFTKATPGPKSNSTSTFLGLPGDDGYILIGAVAAAAVAAVAALLLMKGKKKHMANSSDKNLTGMTVGGGKHGYGAADPKITNPNTGSQTNVIIKDN
jgi:hypothetical protein